MNENAIPCLLSKSFLTVALAAASMHGAAQTIERVKAADASLDCAGIVQERKTLDGVIAAGDPNANALGRTVAGTAANVGGQVAGAGIAQSIGGMFGALGSVVSRVGGSVAQQAAEGSMKPDAAAQQRAGEAQGRAEFLTKLASAKGCKADDATVAGRTLSGEEFQQLASASAPTAQTMAKTSPLTAATILSTLSEPISPYPANGLIDGKLDLRGKRIYLAEFRVLFDIGGKVTANTRAGYLPGRDYGATNVRVNYSVPNIDVAAFQAITDKIYEDFKARLDAAGVKPEDREAFVRENGVVYETTENASLPGAPVFLEKNFGHSERKYLVMAPTGMKLHSRGFTGMGAGNIGKRVDFVSRKLEGVSVSMAVNMAALESSGSSSAILSRGSSAKASEAMTVGAPPDGLVIQAHAAGGGVGMPKPLAVEGAFANFREVGGYNTDKDAVGRTLGVLTNMAGLGANKTNRVDLEVDLDGPATSRMALKGLATVNQAIAEKLKSAL